MIIELVGLPGSGKTTFARKLANEDRFTRVRIKNKYELVWFNFLFLLRFPITFIKLLLLYFKYRGPRILWYTKFTSVFLDYNAKYMKARRVPYAVLDQGHLQVLMSLFEDSLTGHEFKKVLHILPKSDHYIFFAVDETARLEHLKSRGYQSRQGLMTDELRQQWQETAAKHFYFLLEKIKELSPATIDKISDNDNKYEFVLRYKGAHFMRYITFARLPTEKAHGLQITTMCDEFTELGNFISLITPKRSNPIEQDVNSYYGTKNSLQHFNLNSPDIIGTFTKVRPIHHYLHELLFALGVLFMHLPKGLLVYTRTPLVAKVCSWRGRQVVVEMHFWPQKGKSITAWLLKGTKLIANSEGTKKDMEEYGLTATLAHNGFPAEWLDINVSKEEVKKSLGIETDLSIVMYIGNLERWKGVDTLCEAGKLLLGQVQVVVIGGRDDELKKWREKYPFVTFLGSRPYRYLGYNQQAADILVVPNNPIGESEKYTSPIKLFAHLASGRPVIVSDLPTMRTIVDENSVWFFKPSNPDSLAEKVESVLDSGEDVDNKIISARTLANNYTWTTRVGAISCIL